MSTASLLAAAPMAASLLGAAQSASASAPAHPAPPSTPMETMGKVEELEDKIIDSIIEYFKTQNTITNIVDNGVKKVFIDNKPREIAKEIGTKVGNIIKNTDYNSAILLSLLEPPSSNTSGIPSPQTQKMNMMIFDIIKNIFFNATKPIDNNETDIKEKFLKFVKDTLDDPYPLIGGNRNEPLKPQVRRV